MLLPLIKTDCTLHLYLFVLLFCSFTKLSIGHNTSDLICNRQYIELCIQTKLEGQMGRNQ